METTKVEIQGLGKIEEGEQVSFVATVDGEPHQCSVSFNALKEKFGGENEDDMLRAFSSNMPEIENAIRKHAGDNPESAWIRLDVGDF
jgi:hypothetical protein